MITDLLFFFFSFFTFNLLRSHKLFISDFQILKACINFIYHLQNQEMQTIKNLQLCWIQSQEKTIDFLLFILGSYASIYEMNMLRLKPCSFIWNWFSIIAGISEMAILYRKVKSTLSWWLCATQPPGKQYFLIVWYVFYLFIKWYQSSIRDITCFTIWFFFKIQVSEESGVSPSLHCEDLRQRVWLMSSLWVS